jgi:hypothetical protein
MTLSFITTLVHRLAKKLSRRQPVIAALKVCKPIQVELGVSSDVALSDGTAGYSRTASNPIRQCPVRMRRRLRPTSIRMRLQF